MSPDEEQVSAPASHASTSAGSLAKFFQSSGESDELANAINGSNGAEGDSGSGELVRLLLDATAEGLYGIDLEGNDIHPANRFFCRDARPIGYILA